MASEDEFGAVLQEHLEPMMAKLRELGEDVFGFSLVVALGPEEEGGPPGFYVAGGLSGDEGEDDTRRSSMLVLASGVCRMLEVHEDLREHLPMIMESLVKATGGAMVTVDSLEDLPAEDATSPAARAAAKRRLG